MADHDGELTIELLDFLLDPDFSDLSKTEQIAVGKSLLARLESTLEEHRNNPDGGALSRLSRKSVSSDLPLLIGEVVIAAAWAEDAAGTLIQASSGGWGVRAKGYDDTSSSLVKALKKLDSIVAAELIKRLENALRLRHFVVHGTFADGSFIKHPESGRVYDFVSIKRRWRTDAPELEMKALTTSALECLAQEFGEIEAELEDLHSRALFGDGPRAQHGLDYSHVSDEAEASQ